MRWSSNHYIVIMVILIPGKTVFILKWVLLLSGTRHPAKTLVITAAFQKVLVPVRTQLQTHIGIKSHYSDVIMSVMASQINSLTIVYSSVYSCADQRKHQSSASLAFVRGIHRSLRKSPHKGPVTGKMSPIWWCRHAGTLNNVNNPSCAKVL